MDEVKGARDVDERVQQKKEKIIRRKVTRKRRGIEDKRRDEKSRKEREEKSIILMTLWIYSRVLCHEVHIGILLVSKALTVQTEEVMREGKTKAKRGKDNGNTLINEHIDE